MKLRQSIEVDAAVVEQHDGWPVCHVTLGVNPSPTPRPSARAGSPDLTPNSQREARITSLNAKRWWLGHAAQRKLRFSQEPGHKRGRSWQLLLTCMVVLALLHLCWELPIINLWAGNSASEATTLVLYTYSDTDPEFMGNLQYFISMGMEPHDGCHYVIIIQVADDGKVLQLPQLPSNAQYVYHKNECYDWGTFGWLLSSSHVNYTKYKHFILMNSSVRGPFMPTYLSGTMHWTTPLISRLSDTVKLVGPTISCEGSPYQGNPKGQWRRNPHVQSYLLATDRAGLQVMLDDGQVFACHSDRWDAIWFSELGSSAAILRAGYNIDSLMIRYQGVDWRDEHTWGCNQAKSPTCMHCYDGLSLHPYEVMFIKYKRHLVEHGDESTTQAAVKFQEWMDQPGHSIHNHTAVISGNAYLRDPLRFKTGKIMQAVLRGPDCFDAQYYLEASPDLNYLAGDAKGTWMHFVYHGQFDERPFAFRCPMDFSSWFGELSAAASSLAGATA